MQLVFIKFPKCFQSFPYKQKQQPRSKLCVQHKHHAVQASLSQLNFNGLKWHYDHFYSLYFYKIKI